MKHYRVTINGRDYHVDEQSEIRALEELERKFDNLPLETYAVVSHKGRCTAYVNNADTGFFWEREW